jgi:hypothetical protein
MGFVLVSRVSWTQDGCGQRPQENLARYDLQNLSSHRSPIQITGYVTLQDNPAENIRSYWVHASAKNTSKKGIAAWFASLETGGGGGPELNLKESHDYFFTGDVLAPNDAEAISAQSCSIRLVLRAPNGNPDTEKVEGSALHPTASVRVEFVQFTDGSIWGDRDQAAQVQLERRETLDKIKSLEQIYSKHGEKAFMDALSEPTALACFERVKTLCRNGNADSSCAERN